jgi:hypothetical protein
MAITKTDIFDFLIDIVPREDIKSPNKKIGVSPFFNYSLLKGFDLLTFYLKEGDPHRTLGLPPDLSYLLALQAQTDPHTRTTIDPQQIAMYQQQVNISYFIQFHLLLLCK